MGCGVSRFNREDGLPAGSGPTYLYINPLHRRIEDFAFRRRGDRAAAAAGSSLGDGGTPSSKQLLYVDPDDADSSSLSSDHKLDSGGGGGRKSVSSPCTLKNDAVALPPTPRMNEPPVQEVMKANGCGEDSGEEMIKVMREFEEGGKGGEEADEVVKEVLAEKEIGSGADRKEEDEDTDVGGISDREDSIMLYPGSPSFRDYCVLCFDESGDAEDSPKYVDGKSDSVKPMNETEKANMSTSDSIEVPKKSRKRRRFRVTRHGPAGGMRSLLHVSSCSPRRSFNKTT